MTTKKFSLHRPYYGRGLMAGLRWISNPVSEYGASQVPKILYYLTGPNLLREVEDMRQHPVGRKLLQARPAVEDAFDPDTLGLMPEGSFGKILFNLLNFPDTSPGYLLAGLAYQDNFFDSIDAPDEVLWYLDRKLQNHDASHVLSGYLTDFAGEALNIYFALGHEAKIPRWAVPVTPFGLGILLTPPTNMTRRQWLKHLMHAFDRGRAAQKVFPAHSIPYEEIISRPLEEVREELGISPLPDGWDTSDWFEGSKEADDILTGRGERTDDAHAAAKLTQKAVEAGVPWRDFMRASDAKKDRIRKLASVDAPVDSMCAVLAD